MKTIDLTIRQIIKICNKHYKNCYKCPLHLSILDCYKFNTNYKYLTNIYDKEKLMEEEVELCTVKVEEAKKNTLSGN